MKYKWKTTNKKLFYFDQSILQLNRLYKIFFVRSCSFNYVILISQEIKTVATAPNGFFIFLFYFFFSSS